jgi:hypothetical protein
MSRLPSQPSSLALPAPPATWWAPRTRVWWTGALFALGSLCFAVGPLPGFVQLVGAEADAAVFFAGSIAFTTAAALQCIPASWAAAVQFAGTLFFNLSTWNALDESLTVSAENRLVWAPDAFGSVCFLVASALALLPLRGQPGGERRIARINLAGSVAFGVAAVASYVVPDRGSVLDLAAANVATVLGALCFFAGAVPLMHRRSP